MNDTRCFYFTLFLLYLTFSYQHTYSQSIFYEHQKISTKAGNLQAKLQREDHFGFALADIGDLDADGVSEMAVGAPGDDDGGENIGAVWILFMKANGSVRYEQKISLKEGGFTGSLTKNGAFGSAITPLSDLDGDGLVEIAVGERGSNDGGLGYGAVWILYLQKDGFVRHQQKISYLEGGFSGHLSKGFRFGTSLSSLNDINGDGIRELVVGTGMEVEAAKGEFWIISLDRDAQVQSEICISEAQGSFPSILHAGDSFGSALTNIGDLDGDGWEELVVGAKGDDDGGTNNGAVYVLFTEAGGRIKASQKISMEEGNFQAKLDNGDHFGVAITGLGDMDGDSIPDMAVGSYQDDDGSANRGAVWVLNLTTDGSVKSHHKISETSGNFRGNFTPKYEWARGITALADLNQDGLAEIAVGGYKDHDGGNEKGSAWILFPSSRNHEQLYASLEGTPSKFSEGLWPKSGKLLADSLLASEDFDLSGVPDNNLVLLLDVSASMKKADRLPLLRNSFLKLLTYMRPQDRISVITYSGAPEVILEAVPAIYTDSISSSIQSLTSKGSTKTYKALKKAYQLASTHFISNGNNRIVLATDGGFEIEELFKLTDKYSRYDMPLSVFYFGKLPDYKAKLLQELSQRGKGNCSHLLPNNVDYALLQEIKGITH